MKNFKLRPWTTGLALSALLLAGGCKNDDFLNVTPKNALNEANAYASESNADLIVNDIYTNIPDVYNSYQITEGYTDNGFCGASWLTGQSLVKAGSISANNLPTGPDNWWNWGEVYGNIRKCNLFLQNVNKYSANFSASWKKQRTAEVRFMRAFFYTSLATNYGGVPLIDKPLSDSDGTDLLVPRSTMDATVAFIAADCDAAAADLPSTSIKKGDGRATKGAALTLKGWVQLYAASPLHNTSNDLSKWATAAATNKQVMDLGVYSLFSDYAAMFLIENNDNSEVIFNKEYIPVVAGHAREGMLGPVYVKGVQQSWGSIAPTQNLVDDYLMSNGLPITDPNSGYDPSKPYTNREQRFYQSIIYDGASWQGDVITTRVGGNNAIDINSTSDISNTGYYFRKTLDERILAQTSRAQNSGGSNYIIFRLGEVLLSYAEAQNEAVGPDASVYSALNRLRTRSALPNLATGMSQSQMRDYIRRERRIELAFEEKRWFDVRRWQIAGGTNGVMNTPSYGMLINNAGTSYTKVKVLENRYFNYQNLMPLWQGDLAKNTKLTQNTGY